jgi:hypothetical protein
LFWGAFGAADSDVGAQGGSIGIISGSSRFNLLVTMHVFICENTPVCINPTSISLSCVQDLFLGKHHPSSSSMVAEQEKSLKFGRHEF